MQMLKRLAGYCKLLWDLNISKTIYFNIKVFPWHIAIKFPVYFFGQVKFASLRGKLHLDVDCITRGMIQFGCKEENIIATNEPTRISLDGKLVFKGKSKFGHAIQLLVWDNGKLVIGDNNWMGSFTKLVVFRYMDIGRNFLASWECQLFDTNFHFIEECTKGNVSDPNGNVVIGENVWLGNRVTILKNTIIPDNCIIAAGSICNKDYSINCPIGSVIGGVPAKFIKAGFKYINDKRLEMKLFRYFQQPVNFNTSVSSEQIENK